MLGMSPVIALIPMDGEVQKAFRIHIIALYCILLNLLRRYDSSALL